MNKTYRTVWNATTGTWTAAAETARMRTKSKSNTTMRSSVTAAVAVMAGVGGGAMSVDAMAQSTGGGLNLCSNTTAANGVRSGQTFGALSNTINANCAPIDTSLAAYQGHAPSFILANNAGTNGSGAGGAAPTASVMGGTDGHLVVYGANGVHISGPADFNNNVNMTNHRITGLAAGTAGTDAVNLNQLNSALATKVDTSVLNVNQSSAGYAAASAVNTYDIALGRGSVANGSPSGGALNPAIAIGLSANAVGSYTTAMGYSSNARGSSSMALGAFSNASGDGSVALGNGSQATRNNTVSVGNATTNRQITNVAAGTQSTDAVNLGQMNTALSTKVDNTYFKVNSTGAAADAAGANATAIGPNAKANGRSSTAIGLNARADGIASTTLGTDAVIEEGANSAGGTYSAQNSLALGNGARVSATGGNARNSVALGNGASVSAESAVAIGNSSVANVANTVSVGNSTTQRRIVNVGAGTQSTDAVNVGQLSGVTKALGGGAAVDGSGNVTQPTYKVAGTDYHNVGDALDALAASGGTDPNAVTYDGATKDKVTLKGAGGTTLSNVKAGVANTDAVNVGQMNTALSAKVDTNVLAVNRNGSALGAASAANAYDVALGQASLAQGGVVGSGFTPATALGTRANAIGYGAVSVGYRATASADSSLAIGRAATANSLNSVALGAESDTGVRANTVSIGRAGAERQITNVAAGTQDTDAVNVSQLKGSGLIGDDGKSIAAVTYDRNADGTPNYNAVTMGGGHSTGPVTVSNVAAGVAPTDAVNVQQMQRAVVEGNPYIGGRGTGTAAQATGINAVALGLGSVANEINTISVGNGATGLQRRITNVQNGQADTDAATVGQVNDLIGVSSTNTQMALNDIDAKTRDAIQSMNSRLDSINTTASSDSYVQVDGAGDGSDNAFAGAGTFGVAIGAEASATGVTAIAIGPQSVSSGTGSVALGAGASATGAGAVAFGSGRATGTSALALGNGTVAGGNNAVAAGFNSQAAGLNALALGNTARANAADSMAFGTTAQVDALATNSIAIGRQANVTSAAQNAVALGASSVADRVNSISVGSTGQQRQIIYVARGTSDTDAVNVSQLKEAMSSFGGNAGVGADGSIVNPTYTIGGTTYRNVGDALNALENLGSGTDPLAVTYGRNADGSANFEVVALKGADGTTLSNVKAGVADMDAVNVSQLKGSGLIGDDGKAIAAVTYDRNADGTPNYGAVTLGNGTGPTQIKNVADATDDGDALNLGQLKNAGLVGDDGAGNLTSMAVTYDGAAKDVVTLAGTNGTTLSNVKAGVADMDAVNVSQLKGSGLIGDDGKAIAAVTYDRNADGTPNYGAVTLGNGTGPTQIKNVADATDDGDALNLGQLKNAGLVGDDGAGNLTSMAVTYDGAAKDSVTLGGVGATTPVAIHNVADGELSATSKDAVNGSQLFATNQNLGDLKDSLKDGGVIDPATGKSLAVVYDSASRNSVTLGNAGTPVTVSNVARGSAGTDAVNVDQLTDAIRDVTVSPNPLAVSYDTIAKDKVTLGDGVNPVQVTNVADAKDNGDAVNLGQLKNAGLVGDDGAGNLTSMAVTYDGTAKDTVTLAGTNGTTLTNVKAGAVTATSTDAINGAQLHATAQSVADSLGGGSTVDADGKVTNPSYSLADPADASKSKSYDNVGDALSNLDGRTTTNTENITVINKQLADSGLVDPVTGQSISAVTYDRNADGTANLGSVTLGGAGATAPVALKNVADGVDRHDAINLGQLQDAGLVAPVDPTNPGAGLTSLAVAYDGVAKDSVTLGGADGTTLSNVKAGVADMDAVNVSQLKGSGLIGDDGKAIAAVTYDRNADGTPNYGTVTLGNGTGPTQIKNVADAKDDGDALNLGQMKSAGLVGDDGKGNLTSMAVTYDGAAKDTVTLGGAGATTPVALKNVADAKDDGDALNLGQLKNAGLVGEDGTGNLTSLAVTYDGATKDSVTLGGAGAAAPVALHNVADGVLSATSKDAVNGSQLFATNQNLGNLKDSLEQGGVIDPVTGASLAVVYDSAAKNSVTLGNAGTPVGIHNLAAGVVNATSNDAINGSQLFTVSKSVADKIGGGAGVGADGSITDPTYSVGGQDYHSVGDALGALDKNSGNNPLAVVYDGAAKDAVTLGGAGATTPVALKNVADAKDDGDALNLGQLKNAGLVGDDGAGNLTSAAMTYDKKADGTINHDKATLAGTDGTTLSNVKAGVADMDAVNVSQLKDAGLIDPSTGKPIAAVTYDSAAKDSVTLGGTGATTPVALKNVADGTERHDAINLGQLQDAGLVAPVDPTDPGKGLTSLAVTYDGAAKDTVTLKGADGTTLSNVKAGVADMDAVNVSQLKDAGLIDPSTGKPIAAVTYDSAAKDSVTLGGTGATTPVALKNVADAKDDGDALNLGQLKNAGLVGEDGAGNLTSAAMTYDKNADGTINHDKATLAGTDGTTLSNVKAGIADMDAVNVSQLKDAGLIDPSTGKPIAAVTYDGAAKDTVTLGGVGATTPVALKNVADGTERHDAINLGQLQDAGLVAPVDPTNPGAGLKSLAVAYDNAAQDVVTLKGADGTTITNVKAGAVTSTSTDAVNGAQLHGTAQSVADSLGGGSTVGADGKVTNPTYSLADPDDASKSKSYDNVGDALSNLDGRTTTNTENITVINKQLADSGLVDPVTGQSIAAVTYDRNADGTANRGSVTLGGAGATTPVALKNVADGVDKHDAVNVGQLQSAGVLTPIDPTNPGAGLTSLAVTYDKHADGSANFDQITMKGANGTTLSNVKAGAVNATSMDAVNGSQLYGASKSVADALGGGSTVDANGNVTNPTYTVNDKTYDNVGDAIENISSSLVHGSIGLVQQDADTREITVAKDTDGTSVNFAGTAGDRVLTGVGAGAVSATSHDAINGAQLHGTAQSVADVIGGGTTVDADGKLADTSIEVNGSKYKTVAEAVQAAAQYGATDSLAVRYDLNKDGTANYGSVTLGGSGAAPVRLTNVADGSSQYDAVNFGQLSELSDRIGGIDDRVVALEQNPGTGNPGNGGSGNDYFAGTDVGTGSTTGANAGSGTGNTAAGSGATIGTGASNATVIGSNAGVSQSNGVAIGSGAKSSAEGATAIGSGSNASGNQSVAIGQGANASGSNSVALGAGSTAYSDDTVSVGSIDRTRTISNVSDGVNATDVATKGQLDRALGGVQGQMNDLSRNAYSGIAAATALTMIPGVDPGKTVSFGIGGATYKGYQAVAFGGEARITQNLKMKAGVGMSSGGNTVGVGASYQW
ncbi:YadA-like family protein [Burkholderia cepacia]|nr:YadA-like family protein [Burkholderia cepacia]MDO5946480.1 YadA-like family protein [Burkholderia cepacia]